MSKNIIYGNLRPVNHETTVEEQLSAVYKIFADQNGVIEIRALLKEYAVSKHWEGRGNIIFGYFDNEADFTKCAKLLDSDKRVRSVYVTMNPAVSALLARSKNRLQAASGKNTPTTSDNDIIHRRTILIDADPFRPSEISASNEEMEAALARRDEVNDYLKSLGFPDLIKANSGNGGHLIGLIDLPNDDHSKQIVADFLECLNWKFGNGSADKAEAKRQFNQGAVNVSIDTTVFNAAQLTKLYGTTTRKGDNTDDRPYRRSKITYLPEILDVISAKLIEVVAQEWRDHKITEEAKKRQQSTPHQHSRNYIGKSSQHTGNEWYKNVDEVERWLSDHGVILGNRQSYSSDGFDYKWSVDCVTSSEHKDGAVLMWGENKGFGYKCHHNTCKGKGWADVRAIIDPNRQERSTSAQPVRFLDAETGETVFEVDHPTPKPNLMKFADLRDADAAPQLPEYARLTEDEMQEAATTGGWLYDYVEFASKVAPMTPSIFHLSMGLGILSATVARRLHLRVGTQKIYPNLYILYCGPSTIERKTTGMNVGTAVMEAAGMLPTFTFAERQTPEAFVSDTTTAMPYTYDKWTRDAQQYWLSQRAIAGQRAWFLDEASHLLDSFNRDYTSGLLPLVLEIYDSKDRSGGRNTKNYGLEYIEKSYLTVFGATTHASMSKHMQKIEHWHNGLFARFALVTSDQDVEWEFWSKPIEPPKSLVDALRRVAFGVLGELPQVALFDGSTKSDDDDNGGKKRSGYEVVVGELQDTPCIISKAAWIAWERYSKAVGYDILRSSSGNSIEQALFANYGRFSTMQIKVAMLLALCDATTTPVTIERKHILAAQMIVESWRESLHRARGKGRVTEQRTKADDVLNVLAKAGGEWVTKRELTRAMNCTWKDVEETIESLIEECAIEAETYQPPRGRSSLAYRLAK